MHEDEEIRFVLSGSGFFDVRGELKRFKCQLSITDERLTQTIPRTSGFVFMSCRVIFLSFRLAFTTASRLTNRIR